MSAEHIPHTNTMNCQSSLWQKYVSPSSTQPEKLRMIHGQSLYPYTNFHICPSSYRRTFLSLLVIFDNMVFIIIFAFYSSESRLSACVCVCVNMYGWKAATYTQNSVSYGKDTLYVSLGWDEENLRSFFCLQYKQREEAFAFGYFKLQRSTYLFQFGIHFHIPLLQLMYVIFISLPPLKAEAFCRMCVTFQYLVAVYVERRKN